MLLTFRIRKPKASTPVGLPRNHQRAMWKAIIVRPRLIPIPSKLIRGVGADGRRVTRAENTATTAFLAGSCAGAGAVAMCEADAAGGAAGTVAVRGEVNRQGAEEGAVRWDAGYHCLRARRPC